MDYTIDVFWKSRLSAIKKIQNFSPIPGWSNYNLRLESFEEARLTLRPDYTDLTQPVWMIAAPGAVGKSTFAQQLCAATEAIYLDLAVADTVGGNYITGGLVHTRALSAWENGQTTLIIDALDEARLRVTQHAFEDFLQDIWRMAQSRSIPVVLLGRVGIVDEAWAIIADQQGVELPIFNIEHFTLEQARSFVSKRLKTMAHSPQSEREYPHLSNLLRQHTQVYEKLIDDLITNLQEMALKVSEEFVGYAPVLSAVAKLIAVQTNPLQFHGLHGTAGSQVLRDIAGQILERESNKLKEQMQASGKNLPDRVYHPEEQLERLACRLFQIPAPPAPLGISASDQADYMMAVSSLLEQHPFLDGSGRAPSNPVFAACINAAALRRQIDELRNRAEQEIMQSQHTPNPFLYDFYDPNTIDVVPTNHVGLLYESVLSKSNAGDSIGLSIEEGENGLLSVEITGTSGEDTTPEKYQFTTNSLNILTLGRRIANLSIDAPSLHVSLGKDSKDVLEILAPVTVHCQTLYFQCDRLVVKVGKQGDNNAVVLEAQEVTVDDIHTVPLVNKGVEFLVSWPGDTSFPWTDYSYKRINYINDDFVDLLRIFRRLVMAFRSHSRGRLARFKDKIEHARMLKDDRGRALLDKMKSDKIIYNENYMYFLDPDALGEKVGASYQDVKLKRYSKKTLDYLLNIV